MSKLNEEMRLSVLDTIEKELTIKTVCAKLGLSRQTLYRWMKEDASFSKEIRQAQKTAVLDLNDECENRVITKIRNDDSNMIKFWLRYRHPDYKQSYIVTK